MRIAVLVVGILGSLGAGALGFIWMRNVSEAEEMFEKMTGKKASEVFGGDEVRIPLRGGDVEKIKTDYSNYYWGKRAIWFLFGSFVLGIAGSVVAFLGRGQEGGALLVVAFLGPLILIPLTAVFTFFLLIAGILAFFVPQGPAQKPPRRRGRRYDEDEEEDDEYYDD